VVVQLGFRLKPFFVYVKFHTDVKERKKNLLQDTFFAIFRDILKNIRHILTHFYVLEHILPHFNNVKHYCLLMRFFLGMLTTNFKYKFENKALPFLGLC
jgi:hypothetical protein